MCRCAERRQVIVDAASALVRGDASPLAPAAVAVAVTSMQDMVASARRLAAHARLRR